MKQTLLSFLIFGYISTGYAQSKQVKLYLQQIAANRALIDQIQKGSKVAKAGLTFIGDARRGELDLHNTFFERLEKVNPLIRKTGKASDILKLSLLIVKTVNQTEQELTGSNLLTATELKFINSFLTGLSAMTVSDLEKFFKIITSHEYKMNDAERLSQLDKLLTGIQKTLALVRECRDDSKILMQTRIKDKIDVGIVGTLYGLK